MNEIASYLDITSKVRMRNTCTQFRDIPLDDEDIQLIKILNYISIEKSVRQFETGHIEPGEVVSMVDVYHIHSMMNLHSERGIRWPKLFHRIDREILSREEKMRLCFHMIERRGYNRPHDIGRCVYVYANLGQREEHFTFIGHGIIFRHPLCLFDTVVLFDGAYRFRFVGNGVRISDNMAYITHIDLDKAKDIVQLITENEVLKRITRQDYIDRERQICSIR